MLEIINLVKLLEKATDTELVTYFVEVATDKVIKYVNRNDTKEEAYRLYKSAIVEQARQEYSNYKQGNNGTIVSKTLDRRSITFSVTDGLTSNVKALLPTYIKML